MPNVELSAAVHAIENQQLQSPALAQSSPITQQILPDMVEPGQISDQPGYLRPEAPKSISPPDSEYEDAETLDWDESVDTIAKTDGIGSLSTEWKGIGYMGPQTGNTLLRKLQSISVLYLSPEDEISIDHSPSTRLPQDVLNSSRFSDQCINWYFAHFHCAYPILHEGYFRAQLMGTIPLSILESFKMEFTNAFLCRCSTQTQRWIVANPAEYRPCTWFIFWRFLQSKCRSSFLPRSFQILDMGQTAERNFVPCAGICVDGKLSPEAQQAQQRIHPLGNSYEYGPRRWLASRVFRSGCKHVYHGNSTSGVVDIIYL